jgi:hypothetical protein
MAGLTLCNMYRYTMRSHQELPASRVGEILPHRVKGWDSGEACQQAALATICSRQCETAGRHECSGMGASPAGRGTERSLGGQRQRELASDVQV